MKRPRGCRQTAHGDEYDNFKFRTGFLHGDDNCRLACNLIEAYKEGSSQNLALTVFSKIPGGSGSAGGEA